MGRHAFPVSLHLQGRRVVLAGDDAAAASRAQRLAEAGAEVVRIAAQEDPSGALSGAAALFAHTGNAARNRELARAARAAGALAYAHDQPAESDFAMPAVARRGPLKLAVSTDGEAPALSRRMREVLEAALEAAGDELDALLAELVRRRAGATPEERGRLYDVASRLVLEGGFRVEKS